jgi:imidazole glycerol-phosphate synthase subunit HisH
MITIVDYGLGNITAFLNVYRRANIPARTASTGGELAGSTRLILPGVGHFDHAMRQLETSGMRPVLDDLVLRQRVPVLGICVGMQMLAHGSDEGEERGLAWIEGHVRSFASLPPASRLPLPHMGWNDVRATDDGSLFRGMGRNARFYFLHSYYFECARPRDVLAVAEYGAEFGCAVNAGNVFGVQFHPEKSHHFGTQLLRNFAEV